MRGLHIFPKGICPKVNIIARLEFELALYDPAAHRFNLYATRTPPSERLNDIKQNNFYKHLGLLPGRLLIDPVLFKLDD